MIKYFNDHSVKGQRVVEPTEEQEYYCASQRQIGGWDDQIFLNKLRASSILFEEFSFHSIDQHLFRKSYEHLVLKHEALRTVFFMIGDELKFRILPFNKASHSVIYFDLRNEQNSLDLIKVLFEKATEKIRNLNTGPLARCLLYRVSEQHYISRFVMHHIICDHDSIENLRLEFDLVYHMLSAPSETALPINNVQMKDVVRVQNQYFDSYKEKILNTVNHKFSESLSSWHIHNLLGRGLNLGSFNKATKQDYNQRLQNRRGMKTVYSHDKQHYDLTKLAINLSSSPFSIFLTSFYITLYKLTGIPNNIISTIISTRYEDHIKHVIGNFTADIYMQPLLNDQMLIKDVVKLALDEYMDSMNYAIFQSNELNYTTRTKYLLYLNYLESNIGYVTEESSQHDSEVNCYHPLACYIIKFKECTLFKWIYNTELFDKLFIETFTSKHLKCMQLMNRNVNQSLGQLYL